MVHQNQEAFRKIMEMRKEAEPTYVSKPPKKVSKVKKVKKSRKVLVEQD
jgi:hypothetical protein